ncbi:hypothetical protein [Saliphagus sp. LR7]|uniref:hypothetical protein n=1 Tax=Saliphagus sp. LR7 TaxID=2282654 RepID=UPI000DF72F0C|nr:hypothetical protein [Saliphagus sp. LR7]
MHGVLRRVVVRARLVRPRRRRARVVLIAVLVCLLLLSLGIAGACVSKSPVDVTVTDDEGEPVEGEDVTLVDPRTGETVGEAVTDSDGVVSIPADHGPVEVVVGDTTERITVPAQTDVGVTVDAPGLEQTRALAVRSPSLLVDRSVDS